MDKKKKKIIEEFWLKRLDGELPKISLPRFKGAETKIPELQLDIPGNISGQLKKVSKGLDIALFVLFFTGLNVVVNKYTGIDEPVIGSITPKKEKCKDDLIFLRNYIPGHFTFKELIQQMKQTVREDFNYGGGEYSFAEIYERLKVRHRSGSLDIFNMAFIYDKFQNRTKALDRFDLVFILSDLQNGMVLNVEYNPVFYSHPYSLEILQRFCKSVIFIFDNMNEKLEIEISALDILSSGEKKQLLYDFNRTEREYAADKTIHGLFAEQSERVGDRVAVIGRASLSYRELNEKSSDMAKALKEKGVQPGSIVAIMMERSIEMIVTLLAVLKAGGTYLPIDPNYPEERKQYMLHDSGAVILLEKKDHKDAKTQRNAKTIFYDKTPSRLRVFVANFSFKSGAYVIYTSGSTGKPKGTLTTHRNVLRVVTDTNYIQLKENDRILQLSNYAFDGSVFDIYGALLNGAALVLVELEVVLAVDRLADFIKREQITVFFVTTALFNALVDLEIGCFANVRKVLFGGERVSLEHSKRALGYLGKNKIIHVYGPTETTVYAAYYFIDHIAETAETIPIGRPISNTTAYIVNKTGGLVPIGTAGELYLGGDGLARGYLNNPELTAKRFSRRRQYKTGDLGRWLPDGNIEFLGRLDHQVKIRGFRVELGEIENRLLGHPGIKEAVVVIKADDPGDKQLCAYIVVNKTDAVEGLREYLAEKLPDYMIPSYFVTLAKIPLTANGKLDRKALPEPEISDGKEYAPPRGEIEEKLVEIWAKVLKVDKGNIGIDDNFFHLGGHSLKGTVVTAKVHKEFNVRISLAELFNIPTIRELSAYIKRSSQDKHLSIAPVEKKEYYALSSAQKRLYILAQMELESTGYNMPFMWQLAEEPDPVRLENAFKQLIRRHESFRTGFMILDDEPVQGIKENYNKYSLNKSFAELFQKRPCGAGTLLGPGGPPEALIKSFIRPFDLSCVPLLRAGLIKGDEGKNILMVDMHHIISDGMSMEIFQRELIALYELNGLPPLKIQYKDYVRWQDKKSSKEKFKEQEAYWLRTFAGEIPQSNLPLDYPRPALQSFAGGTIFFETGKEGTKALRTLAKDEGLTLFMLLSAIFNILLGKLTGREDIIVGTPSAGRRHADLENIIGMFVNTLALRNYPVEEKPFNVFLKELKKNILAAFENQEYPFEELVDRLSINRDTGRNPLFDTMFVMQNLERRETENRGLKLSPYKYESNISKFDLTLIAVEAGETLLFHLQYGTKLFKKETIERFTVYFKNIISSVTAAPGARISALEIISREEKTKILYDFNDTAAEFPEDKTIHQLFEEQAERTPDNIAVTAHSALTYRELNKKSHRSAHLLKERGVLTDSIVGIMVERSPEMIIGMLGILKAGGAYLPIDPGYPGERKQYMLQDSGAVILLATEEGKTRRRTEKGDRLAKKPRRGAYVIYTSGTTGRPKGVLVTHRSLVNMCTWHNKYYAVTERDKASQYASPGFDASVGEIFPYLIKGAALHIIPGAIKPDIYRLNAYFLKHNITIGFLPTPVCEQFMFIEGEDCYLRVLLTGGDKLRKFKKRTYRLYNNYGPTENTMAASCFPVDEAQANIPIGSPISNNRIYILNKNNNIQPIGTAGELYITGDSLSNGYLNHPELTAERFCLRRPGGSFEKPPPGPPQNFFLNFWRGVLGGGFFKLSPPCRRRPRGAGSLLIYKTGDLARWLGEGVIEYLGRLDSQVKIRGTRIELAEVESYLLRHRDIEEAVVTVGVNPGDNDPYLCAYFVSGQPLGAVQLKEFLAAGLPGYMIPLFFVPLEEIPLTGSGKIDRKALPAPELKGEGIALPRDRVDEILLEMWQELLGLEKGSIGIDSNFFQLGGHSLKATLLTAKIHKEFQVKVSLAQVFKTPFIRGLSEHIRGAGQEKYIAIQPAPDRPYYPLSSAQKRFYILQQMEPGSTVYNMPLIVVLAGDLDGEKLENAFHCLIRRHEGFRTAFETAANEPVQKIYETVVSRVNLVEAETREHAKKIVADFIRPFDLSRAPIFRVGLVKIREQSPEQEHILMMDMHHILSDGLSHPILLRELMTLYDGGTLPELKLQYKDYALWQHLREQAGVMKKQEEYWLHRFSGDLPVLDIPTDFPRPEVQGFAGSVSRFEISSEESRRLRAFAGKENATLFMVVLALANILLYKLSGREDIVTGTTVAGRRHPDLENIIGVFLNTLALRNYPAGEKTFLQFFREVREHSLEAFDNQDYQFEDLVQKVMTKAARDPSRNPLFDVLVLFASRDPGTGAGLQGKEEPARDTDTPGLRVEPFGREAAQARFDMLLTGGDTGDQLGFIIEYSTALFKKETVERYIKYFKEIISAVLDNEDIRLEDIEISTRLGFVTSDVYNRQDDFEF